MFVHFILDLTLNNNDFQMFKISRVYLIHPRVYKTSKGLLRVHGYCTTNFSFEIWLHHSTSIHVQLVIGCLVDGMER